MSRLGNFLKDHILGIFMTSVVAGLASTWIFQVFPFSGSKKEVVSGVVVLNNFGKYMEKYGVRFESPPKLGFFNKYGSVYTGGAIDVMHHENDGFTYEIARGFSVGEQVTWMATGTVKKN